MKCGNLAFQCRPPSMCGWDKLMQRWYCCSPGVHAVCSTSAQTCNGRDNKTPAANQHLCGAGINSYCCDSTREVCTQRDNQINICWSKSENILEPLNATKINETYHSLSSAFPSAASYTIDRAALFQFTSTLSSPSTSPTLVATHAAAPESFSSQPPAAHHDGLSGGAIGGIITGVFAGAALSAVVTVLLWRRRKHVDKDDSHLLLQKPSRSTNYINETEHAKGSGPRHGILTVTHSGVS